MNTASFVSGVVCTFIVMGTVWGTCNYHTTKRVEELTERNIHLANELHNTEHVSYTKLTVGIRNNNPMNIVGKGWRGQCGSGEKVDSIGHAVFENIHYGLRAGARTLINMQFSRGCRTIRQYVDRYCETNKDAYIKHLSQAMGIGPDQEFLIYDYLAVMMKTIIKQENGYNPYPDSYFIPYTFISNL